MNFRLAPETREVVDLYESNKSRPQSCGGSHHGGSDLCPDFSGPKKLKCAFHGNDFLGPKKLIILCFGSEKVDYLIFRAPKS